jgi:CBS domain containing-hemolysin-like protein
MIEGSAELRVIESLFQIDLPGKPTDTVGLWILSNTEKIPRAGETFIIDELEVKIVKATRRSIEKVIVRRTQQPDG